MQIENLKRLKNIAIIGEVVDNLRKLYYGILNVILFSYWYLLFLLLVVIFISAKPISMGIEARRNLNEKASKTKLDEIFLKKIKM